MAKFYVSDNKIYMDDGMVSLHIADLRLELTETQKAEIKDAFKRESSKNSDLFSALSTVDARLYDARREIEEAMQQIGG